MTKDDLIQKVKECSLHRFAFVGPNGSGKSYMLRQIYENIENAILIDEEGFTKATDKRLVAIFENQFIYDEKYNRGKSDYKQEVEQINSDSLKIIKVLKILENKLPSKNKSAGINKIGNILKNLLSRNINSVNYFFFDEPDNYLDDEHIKFLKCIFDVLLNNNKTVCFVTHSSRLLEILNIDIDDIYIFQNWADNIITNVSTEQLKQVYIECCEEVSKIKYFSNCEKKEKFFYSKYNKLLEVNLYNIIHSHEFYRSLFFNDVVIAEGLTEKLVFNESNNFAVYAKNFYFCKGKSRYPLMLKIFSLLNKNVILIYDEDNDKQDKFTYTVNCLFENYKKIVFTPNLEDELIITKKVIIDILGGTPSQSEINDFKQFYKAEILPFALRNDRTLLQKLEEKVTNINTSSYQTFNLE